MKQKSYEVVFKKSAVKELETLPEKIQQKILDGIQLLALNPYTELLQIKKLKGAENLYRFRIQDYRVIYTLEGNILKITVIKVGHRKEVYK
jgi:mRNA interferase RelE/StbE